MQKLNFTVNTYVCRTTNVTGFMKTDRNVTRTEIQIMS